MGAVDQLVGAMLNNYLEENPKDAKTLVQKDYFSCKSLSKLQVRLEDDSKKKCAFFN